MDRRNEAYKVSVADRTALGFDEMAEANRLAGGYWWEPDTLRFFRSRMVGGCAIRGADGRLYFVTSEQNHGFGGAYPRLYSVRTFDPATASVDTVGEFQAYGTRGTALRARDRAAKAEVPAA